MADTIGTDVNQPVVDAGTSALQASPTPRSSGMGPPANHDISPLDGERIVAEAATWAGTKYVKAGAGSVKGEKGDCSGTTYKIYDKVGFGYPYQRSNDFPDYATQTGQFRKVDTHVEPMHPGDVLWWPGHMAIYAHFADGDPNHTTHETNKKRGTHWTQDNDMWTATNPGGDPYRPHSIAHFSKGRPTVYRYQLIDHAAAGRHP